MPRESDASAICLMMIRMIELTITIANEIISIPNREPILNSKPLSGADIARRLPKPV